MDAQAIGGPSHPVVRPGLAVFAGLLLAALLGLFPEVFSLSHTFFYRDYALFGYPLAAYHHQSFWQGEIPLWNPYSNCGLPFLAQWNTLTLYPLSVIYLLFPLPWSLGFFNLGHLVLGGLGMYFLARAWTRDPVAAAIAGLAFALNGLNLHALMWPNVIAALGWMPWVVWALERAAVEGGRRVVVAALLAGLQLLAGAPEVIGLTWLIAGAIILAHLWSASPGGLLKLPGRLVLAGVIAAGFAAAQLLPFLELVAQSQRDAQYDTNAWAMPAWGWANLLVPLFHTTPSLTGVHTQLEQQWTSSYYTGIATLALALLALGRKGDRRIPVLVILAVLGLWLSLGAQGGLHAALKTIFPPLGLVRYPIKFVVLTLFALPLLAAFGLAAWNVRQVSGKRLATVLAGLGLAILLIILWCWRQPVPWEDWKVTAWNGIVRLLLLAGFGGMLWWWRRVEMDGRTPPHWFTWLPIGLLAVVALDAITHVPRQNPTVAVAAYAQDAGRFPGKPALGEGRVCISPATHFKMGYAVNPNALQYCDGNRRLVYCNWNLVDRIPKVDGFYSLYTREQQQVQSLIYGSTNRPPAPLLDFMGVDFISSETDWFAWTARTKAMPLLSIGQRPVFSDQNTTLRKLGASDFEPRREVCLPEATAGITTEADPEAVISPISITSHRLTARLQATRPTLAVIAQTWHPNWRAWIDDQPVSVLRANHAFQAISVPPGRHELRLAYVDRPFQIGAAISLLTLAGCLVGLIFWRPKVLTHA